MKPFYINGVILCNKYIVSKSNLFFNIETFLHAIQCVDVCQSPANHTVPPDTSQLSVSLFLYLVLQTAVFGFMYPPVFNFSSPLHRKC